MLAEEIEENQHFSIQVILESATADSKGLEALAEKGKGYSWAQSLEYTEVSTEAE